MEMTTHSGSLLASSNRTFLLEFFFTQYINFRCPNITEKTAWAVRDNYKKTTEPRISVICIKRLVRITTRELHQHAFNGLVHNSCLVHFLNLLIMWQNPRCLPSFIVSFNSPLPSHSSCLSYRRCSFFFMYLYSLYYIAVFLFLGVSPRSLCATTSTS